MNKPHRSWQPYENLTGFGKPVRFNFLNTMWQSKADFKARVREWAQKLDVPVKTISLRAMKRKWASYTQASSLLIFNTQLLEMERELGDYVIVHELLHFRAPNHGKLWKSLMHAYLGDYEILEEQLRAKTSQVTENL